jgi:hypothetical protein
MSQPWLQNGLQDHHQIQVAAKVACLIGWVLHFGGGRCLLFAPRGGASGLAVRLLGCGVGEVCLLADLAFQQVVSLRQQLDLVLEHLDAGRHPGLGDGHV